MTYFADTSRPIRQGENDGDGYWFITREEVSLTPL